MITPFINIYALIFLVGGAFYSAWKYYKTQDFRGRFWGNLFIAIGGLLPGIGGTATKFGYTCIVRNRATWHPSHLLGIHGD